MSGEPEDEDEDSDRRAPRPADDEEDRTGDEGGAGTPTETDADPDASDDGGVSPPADDTDAPGDVDAGDATGPAPDSDGTVGVDETDDAGEVDDADHEDGQRPDADVDVDATGDEGATESPPRANGTGDGTGNGDVAPFVTEAEESDAAPDPAPGADEATQEDVEHAIDEVDVATTPDPVEEESPPDDALEGIDAETDDLPFDAEDAPEPEETFDEVEVGTVDEEEVWSHIQGEEPSGPSADAGPDDPGERRETVVPKNVYCERCEHFSPPPRMECTHDGTEIIELVGREHVRVIDCPIVEERDALGEREADPAAGGVEDANDSGNDVFIE